MAEKPLRASAGYLLPWATFARLWRLSSVAGGAAAIARSVFHALPLKCGSAPFRTGGSEAMNSGSVGHGQRDVAHDWWRKT